MKSNSCKCRKPPIHYSDYIECYLGVDETNGRYGDISLEKCIHCNSIWVHYYVQYEAFSESGRWFRGIIDVQDILNITPENSAQYLESLEWHLYGGSYFSTTGKIGRGIILVDF